MHRISSNWTLFYKFFIPTFWIVFFGAVTIASLLTGYAYVGDIPRSVFQAGVLLFFGSGVAMFYFTLMRLKRVELSEDFVYVTNYFQHVRYPYHNVDRIVISRFLFFRTASLYLHSPGRFGSHITFIPLLSRLNDFLDTHPEVKNKLHIDDRK